ncbi:MAG: NnrU family protein [Paracoccus sp. (in: a-proteobacteria)]|nr:NnrU family protein [Paracoccus sp. (in: a-proteobacteria)]
MFLLILGVALWWAAHLFKRAAPAQRASMGDSGRAAVAAGLVLSVILMVIGYRSAAYVHVWSPPLFLTHINNLLMLIAVYLFVASGAQTRITRGMRHPQLIAFKTWAFAHLLVNGDLASVILFGGLLAWAVVQMIAINRALRAGAPAHSAPWPIKGDIPAIIATIAVFAIIALIHMWIGPNPFGGA